MDKAVAVLLAHAIVDCVEQHRRRGAIGQVDSIDGVERSTILSAGDPAAYARVLERPEPSLFRSGGDSRVELRRFPLLLARVTESAPSSSLAFGRRPGEPLQIRRALVPGTVEDPERRRRQYSRPRGAMLDRWWM